MAREKVNEDKIKRYQPGGDLYQKAAAQFGTAAANDIARSALTGDQREVNSAFQRALNYGAPLETSTTKIFFNQIATDPLGAPLDSANAAIGNVFGSTLGGILRNPWVLAVIAGLVWFHFFRKK